MRRNCLFLFTALALALDLPCALRASGADMMQLVRLSGYEKARCMDGSKGAYYISKGDPEKFVIHLQGGGECVDSVACGKKVHSSLGSSKYFSETFNGYQLISAQTENAILFNWTRIFVPYCSQDLHSGTRTTVSNSTFGYYFSGHHIFASVVKNLISIERLGKASDVVLTGGSAGGIGVWINIDYLQNQIPAANVVGAPIAGYYDFAYPYMGPHHTSSGLADFREPAWPSHVSLWNSRLPAACAAHYIQRNESARCMLSRYSAPFATARFFVIEAQTDKVQLEAHDWLPSEAQNKPIAKVYADYMLQWRENQSAAFNSTLKASDGFFSPACFIHTGFSATGPLISNQSFYDAFNAWLIDDDPASPSSHHRLRDNCGLLCGNRCTGT